MAVENEVMATPRRPSGTRRTGQARRADGPEMDLGSVYGGVSAAWLAQVFGQDPKTVKKKLGKGRCPIAGYSSHKAPLYLIHEAAAYLVKPKIDLVEYIKSLRPNDLPPMLNDAYWAAMIKRQKWQENAGELWHTDDVLRVFGDVAFMYKTTSQLWVEELDRLHSLSPELRQTVTRLVDQLLESVHEELVNLPMQSRTYASVAEEGAVPDKGGSSTREVAGEDGDDSDVI